MSKQTSSQPTTVPMGVTTPWFLRLLLMNHFSSPVFVYKQSKTGASGNQANQSCVNMRKDKSREGESLLSKQFIYSCWKQQRSGYQNTKEQPNNMMEVLCRPTADWSKSEGRGHTVEICDNTSCQKWLIIFKAAKQGFTIDGIQLPGPQYQFLDWVTKSAEEGKNPFLCAFGLWRFYRAHIEHRSLSQYQLEFLAISKEIPEKDQSLWGQIAVVFEHFVGCHRNCVPRGSHSLIQKQPGLCQTS